MDKYTLLILLNIPFVILGIIKAIVMYKEGLLQRLGLAVRLTFWSVILLGLLFTKSIYSYLFARNLTDTTPLSLAEVILVTGVIFCLFLCARLYAKIDLLERRLSDLHEKTSVANSIKK
jgi:hypothetical protein